MSITCALHYRSNVSKVKVYVRCYVNKLGYTLNTAAKNVVGNLKCVCKSDSGVRYLLESFVRNDDKRVNKITKLCDTGFSLLHSELTLKCKGLGNDTNCKYIHLSCYSRNDRSSTRSGSASHTCGNEYHISTVKSRLDLLNALFCRSLTNLGLSACAVSLSYLLADSYFISCIGFDQSHLVRVDR